VVFSTYLARRSQEITEAANTAIMAWQKDADEVSNRRLTPLLQAFAGSIAGGKCLRGMLVSLGYELAGGRDHASILAPAAAIEILHTSLLIHDDIMDNSDLRRGKPTLHRAVGGSHYGLSQAMCLADIGFFLSVKLIAESAFSDEAKNRAIVYLSQTTINTGIGQMLDVQLSTAGDERNEADVQIIERLKTAEYSVIGPLSLGAMLGGASGKQLAAIGKYGTQVGIAYQIRDDILGVYGDEQTLGKPVTSDIEENKNTLLIAYAQEHGTREEKQTLEDYYGKGRLTLKQHEAVKRAFISSGALAYAEAQAAACVTRAEAAVPAVTADPELQTLLREFATFIIKREK